MLQNGCKLPVESLTQLKYFMQQLVESAVYIHSCGFLHGDFKRENIRFDGTLLTVIDFDCAIQLGLENPPYFCVGTRGYRAPEPEQPASFPADVWSIGIVFGRELL